MAGAARFSLLSSLIPIPLDPSCSLIWKRGISMLPRAGNAVYSSMQCQQRDQPFSTARTTSLNGSWHIWPWSPDVCRLRLACKALSAKASQGYFRQHFRRSQDVDLTSEALQAFTKRVEARCGQLRNLNLIGIAPKPRPGDERGEARARRQNHISYLTQAFDTIAERQENHRLESLTLRVVIVHLDGARQLPAFNKCTRWYICRRVWVSAVDTWQVALQALAASKLRIEKLTVFNDGSMELCSLPCNMLITVDLEDSRLVESLANLKSLSLSVCDRIFDPNRDIVEPGQKYEPSSPRDFEAEAEDETNFTGVAKFIKLCSKLEELHFHYCRVFNPAFNVHTGFHPAGILQRMAELESLPKLTKCTMRGIFATETDLLAFIKRTDASDLTLEHIILVKGTFRAIIDHCVGDHGPRQALLLDFLHEREGNEPGTMVLFPWYKGRRAEVAIPVDRIDVAKAESLKRQKDDIKQPVSFLVAHPWFIASPTNMIYKARDRLEYGANS
ncbi:hypothetical protein TESG_03333 [Trichophyton tonsurans CBS 112818]|uniref:Uncharacterized protein n=1 Tax=Trichophyton tonsurans (strain CBS 112818) TaxID=647933 RepID=F2RX20_TRIT1|nr:hypothetical protein TESG_03333 [Trichophyton tonsurans CBS 112818]